MNSKTNQLVKAYMVVLSFFQLKLLLTSFLNGYIISLLTFLLLSLYSRLSANNLNGELPDSLGKLTNLKELWVI